MVGLVVVLIAGLDACFVYWWYWRVGSLIGWFNVWFRWLVVLVLTLFVVL